MSFTDIKNKNQGFTIVELLIVVVVIAILAAITIVSYNGITNRANQSASKSSAATVQKKAELYFAETSAYPTVSQLTGAGSDKSYAAPASSFTSSSSTAPTKDNGKNQVQLRTCSTASPAAAVGAQVIYWNYGADSATTDTTTINLGTTSGTGVTCA